MASILFKNASITYTDKGKGKVIVLLHGFLENSKMWNKLASDLIPNFRVITVDLLGHGESENIGYVHTMEDMADVVYEVLTSLSIQEATFIGHSMGGYVALALAALYPEKINGLVLLNSSAKADSKERKANRDRAIKAVKQNYVATISMSVANLFSETNRNRLIPEINWAKTEALQTSLQGIIAAQEGMKVRVDRTILLHTTTFPKLLILGKKDTVLPYLDTITQTENTNVSLVTLDGGHMSHLENPKEITAVILDFLNIGKCFY